jgi:hypothetical protein
VRLDVPQRDTLRPRNRRERAYLRENEILDVTRCNSHFTSAETLQIGESWVGADRHAGVARKTNRSPHHGRIPRVPAARNVRGGDVRHHRFVCPYRPGTERFTKVAVEVD